MNLSADRLLEITQYSIVHLDGGWFLALAAKLGKEKAWEMDIEAWKQFSQNLKIVKIGVRSILFV